MMCVEDEGFMHMDSKESEFASVNRGKLRDNGDLNGTSDLLASTGGKQRDGAKKRKHYEIVKQESINLDQKKSKRTVNSAGDEKGCAVAKSGWQTSINDDDDNVTILDKKVFNEEVSRSKRKQSSFLGMLKWLTKVAENPCASGLIALPEKSKWKSYGNEVLWKQVLLAREAMFHRQDDGKDTGPVTWQRNQKTDLRTYDDNIGSSYNLRDRSRSNQKVSPGEQLGQAFSESFSSSGQSNLDKSPSTCLARMGNNAGEDVAPNSSTVDLLSRDYNRKSQYQAVVPDCNGVSSESDSKWLGTKVWPLNETEKRTIIERDPIGKGRQDSCGCLLRGSSECVRFHIAEKRLKLKIELGSAFYRWNFHKMGEEVRLAWTEEERNEFTTIMKMNSLSEDKCFWDKIFRVFPRKSREELVSYYFNVFLLQRRGCQNRVSPNDINSDDDEAETNLAVKWGGRHETKSTSSIFYSPAKSHANSKK
ncbi:hypothetical protein BT93_D2007 [Corymbia citriodora subsp. variegata]|nr:hypothetical protein BT93_D2007 [Corymbia citriodora subsp. variegata]KAF8033270.1 hypothetical protein BT93_D2007 [Corymbia citriodora subsp. variegata]KAF8033271.1 hypothetical protein BT93_D2007 [Corymbia citriodora subsp. variegata]KAF8033272.1 hypothetical protein BT93_D2007 [Corymbia citriodora subsp. variegata]